MSRYYIDVGGLIYCSTEATLKKSPILKSLIESHNDPNDTLFIDRDGNAFYYVLNFLRNGSVCCSSGDRAFVEMLALEAGFYGLREMESQLLHERRKEKNEIAVELKLLAQQLACVKKEV